MKKLLALVIITLFCVCATYSQDLDKPIDAKRTFKMDFLFEGWYNQFAGKDIVALMNILKNGFSHTYDDGDDEIETSNYTADAGLSSALQYFMTDWPASSEIMALGGGVDNDNWNSTNARDTSKPGYHYDATKIAPAKNFFLDEYGRMVTSTSSDSNYNAGVMSRWNANYETISESSSSFVASGRVAGTPSGTLESGGYTHYIDAINIYIDGKKYTIQDQVTCSPIVFDMDGDGQLQASNGQWLPHKYSGGKLVKFDMDGDGFVDMSEWVGPNDGLLIVYKGQETITGLDMFGDADGFLNGYVKLQLLDGDKNSKLNGEELKTLSVWQDKNGNAKAESEEIKTLKELGITEINLNHKNLVSNFVQNGETKAMWDWYPSTFEIKATE